jgi:hypothetical protein
LVLDQDAVGEATAAHDGTFSKRMKANQLTGAGCGGGGGKSLGIAPKDRTMPDFEDK